MTSQEPELTLEEIRALVVSATCYQNSFTAYSLVGFEGRLWSPPRVEDKISEDNSWECSTDELLPLSRVAAYLNKLGVNKL